jgi:predicted nucleic acid-binding protein
MSAIALEPIGVFIDTNVFLSFFHYTSDALDDLEKLVEAAKQGRIRLLLPDQIVDEFTRDREVKLLETRKKIAEAKGGGQYPHAFRDDEEYDALRELESQFNQVRSRVITRFEAAALASTLKADGVIQSLFGASSRVPADESITQAAEIRRRRGNPPGKRETLGDQICWESLLKAAELKELCVVSGDRDWRSPLDERRIHPYLAAEWNSRREGQVSLYHDLRSFVEQRLPDVAFRFEEADIGTEEAAERTRLIASLRDSPSFQTTHSVIAQLGRYTEFTTHDLNQILLAAVTNSQVSSIVNDEDVGRFLRQLIEGRERDVEPRLLSELTRLFEEGSE